MDTRNYPFSYSHGQDNREGRSEQFRSGVSSFHGAYNNQFNNSRVITVGGNYIENQESLHNQTLMSLPIATTAAHTAYIDDPVTSRRACTEGTRVQVLGTILGWLNAANSEPVFWLTGAAGMGKTTIAMTICQEVAKEKDHPLVSFFCSRQLDSSKSSHLVPSICRRLADHLSSYAAKLVDALQKDSTLAPSRLHIQFEKMLVQPWKDSTSQREGLALPIVVVDRLDENKGGFDFMEMLLDAISNGELQGLCFLVTMRQQACGCRRMTKHQTPKPAH